MKKGSIRNVTSCDFDLHQVNKPIVAWYRDASHARREMKLHRRLWCKSTTKSLPPTTTTTINDNTLLVTRHETSLSKTTTATLISSFWHCFTEPTIRSTPTMIFLMMVMTLWIWIFIWSFQRPHWSFQPNGLSNLGERNQLSSGFWWSSSSTSMDQRGERK